jgi:hypothetical protein
VLDAEDEPDSPVFDQVVIEAGGPRPKALHRGAGLHRLRRVDMPI